MLHLDMLCLQHAKLQAVLLQRIKDLENELQQAAESEQKKTAQIARLEGRAAVAEGSLKAAQQQISQALTDVQEHRAKVTTEQPFSIRH